MRNSHTWWKQTSVQISVHTCNISSTKLIICHFLFYFLIVNSKRIGLFSFFVFFSGTGNGHHKWLPVCVWRNNRLHLQHRSAQTGPHHTRVDSPQTVQPSGRTAWGAVSVCCSFWKSGCRWWIGDYRDSFDWLNVWFMFVMCKAAWKEGEKRECYDVSKYTKNEDEIIMFCLCGVLCSLNVYIASRHSHNHSLLYWFWVVRAKFACGDDYASIRWWLRSCWA